MFQASNFPDPNFDGGDEYLSIWPGLGGWNGNGTLVQSGTESDIVCPNRSIDGTCPERVPRNYFWFEIWPDESQMEVTNLLPNANDDVFTESSWSGGVASFMLCDYTQNLCVKADQSSSQPGSSAEWIAERTAFNGSSDHYLPNFGTINFTGSIYQERGSWQTPSLGNAATIDMGQGGHLLDQTETSSNYSMDFPINWLRGY